MESSTNATALPFSTLIDVLRSRGLTFGLHDYGRLARLLSRYDGNSTSELRSAIAALLGHDQRDQILIREVFDELFAVEDRSATEAAEPTTPLPQPLAYRRPWSTAAVRWAWLAIATLVSALMVAVWLLTQPVALPPLPPPPAHDLPTPWKPPVVQLGPTVPPVAPPRLPPIAERQWDQVTGIATGVAAVLAICGAALRGRTLLLRRRRRGWRSILAGLPGPQFYRLDPGSTDVVPRHVIDEVATVLTRRRDRLKIGRHLDVAESVRRTLRAGLWPHVVFMPACRILPTVVLQDVSREMGPWRTRVERFLIDLERQGVPLDRYYFDASAARISRSPFGAPLALSELARFIDDAALLVISAGSGILDALSEPVEQSWLTLLKRWPRRSWIAPFENLAHARPELRLVPMHVWPMTPAGLHAMAAELADEDRRDTDSHEAIASRQVTSDDVERVKRLVAMAPTPVSVEVIEQLRMRFCPDVPRDVIVHLLSQNETLGADAVVLNDAERARLVAAQLRDSVPRAIAVQQFLQSLMDRSEPPATSAAHLRWQADRALLAAQVDELGGGRSEAALAALRGLASGPLGDEVRSRAIGAPVGPKLRKELHALSQAPDAELPGERRRLRLARPAPGHVIGAALGGLATAGLLIATGTVPVRAVDHVRDAFALEWAPDPSGGIAGDTASRGRLLMSVASPPGSQSDARLEDIPAGLPVSLYRDGSAIGSPRSLSQGSVAEQRLDDLAELGHWYQLRAPLGGGRFALSNDVWVPGQPPPGLPLRVVIDAAPWARVQILDVSSRQRIDAPDLVTPFTIELPEGNYLLELENGGLTPPTQQEIAVRVGDPNTFRIVMPGFDVEKLLPGTLTPPPTQRR